MRFQKALLTVCIALIACACSGTMSLGDKPLSSHSGGSGVALGGTGAGGTGGTLAAGGTSLTGGTSFFGSGGTESRGGTMGSAGGSNATGGATSTGSPIEAGGSMPTGGTTSTGGTQTIGGTGANSSGTLSTTGGVSTGGAEATDGFGTCEDSTCCNHEDGWRECIASNDSFRTCQSGHWEFTLCNEGELCTNMGDGAATCGNDCIPDKTRCVGADYQVCSSDGTWGKTEHCSAGECNLLTNDCEVTCVPGQMRCTGDVVVASDTTSLGSRTVERCTTSRAWSAAETCSSSTLCRRSGMGEHLGCVQCVGPEVIGGNEEAAIDSRCSTDTNGYQTCQADNTWPAADTACAETEHCAKQRDGSITGTCSNHGCAASSTRSKRCIGYETVTDPVTIDDCCAGECDSTAGKCLHRKSHYDSTCVDTISCFTSRYDTNGDSIYETCCSGYCKLGQGCLKIKAPACSEVTSCSIAKVDHSSICCGTCLSTGLCTEDAEAQHPVGEYFDCGSSTNVCWRVGSCSWQASGSTSGAMFANCVE